jgi:preprotein translocase subunit SecD
MVIGLAVALVTVSAIVLWRAVGTSRQGPASARPSADQFVTLVRAAGPLSSQQAGVLRLCAPGIFFQTQGASFSSYEGRTAKPQPAVVDCLRTANFTEKFSVQSLSTVAHFGSLGASGTTLALEMRPGEDPARDAATVVRRIEALGLDHGARVEVTNHSVLVTGEFDQEEQDIISSAGFAELRTVDESLGPADSPADCSISVISPTTTTRVACDRGHQRYRLAPPAPPSEQIASSQIVGARAERAISETAPPAIQVIWQVRIMLSSDGQARLQRLTAPLACLLPNDPRRQLAIVIDGTVWSAPRVAVGAVVCGLGIQSGPVIEMGREESGAVRAAHALSAALQGPLAAPVAHLEREAWHQSP